MQHNRLFSFYMRSRGTLLSLLVVLAVFFGGQPGNAEAAAGCLTGAHCIYLPVVSSQVPAGDLVLDGVEVTQGIQNSQNSVPLVAGRRTIVRIYAWSGETSKPLSNVQVQVTASSGGITLSSSPAVLTAALPLTSQRADYSSSINYELPPTWLQGTIDLTIRLDPADQVFETNETNNVYRLQLTFNPVPPLQIKIVPVQYTHTKTGVTYPAPSSDTISDWILRTYPVSQVDVSWHAVYPFTGDLSSINGWYTLLDEITALKSAEGAPAAQVYYALVPVSSGTSTWFLGGTAGIGWVGSRVAVGLDTSRTAPQIAAHEVGHNLGLWHSPCGNPSGVDPDFPYPGGTIGQYGLDVWNGVLYSPDYLDFMSYCSPRWVSDYTFVKLYQSQVKNGASPSLGQTLPGSPARRSLMVRYNFDSDGVQALPAYVLTSSAQGDVQPGDYTLQVLGAGGEVLSETQAAAFKTSLDDAERSAINASIPLPDQPAAKLRLLKDGLTLVEQTLELDAPEVSEPVVTSSGEGSLSIRWSEPNRPAIVRYSADGGRTWTILGVDVMGGSLTVNTGALPEAGAIFEVIPASAWSR